MVFREGFTKKRLVGKLETHNIETVAKLFALADKCAREMEASSRTERRNTLEEPTSLERSRSGNKKNKQKAVVTLATEGRNKHLPGKNLQGLSKAGPGETGSQQVVRDPQNIPA
jgi:hypothetical protein